MGDIVEKKEVKVRQPEPEPAGIITSKDNPKMSVFKARRQK